MLVHARAPLSPIGRRRVVDRVVVGGWSVAAAAEAAGVTERTVWRWIKRFREEGEQGLVDRSSQDQIAKAEKGPVLTEMRDIVSQRNYLNTMLTNIEEALA